MSKTPELSNESKVSTRNGTLQKKASDIQENIMKNMCDQLNMDNLLNTFTSLPKQNIDYLEPELFLLKPNQDNLKPVLDKGII